MVLERCPCIDMNAHYIKVRVKAGGQIEVLLQNIQAIFFVIMLQFNCRLARIVADAFI